MARIRTIKPEFWTSEQVMELSRDARLLFIGLLNFCDDAGIHPAKPKTLKAEVFPADDLTSESVRRLIDECIEIGLVDEYEIDGERFWIVTGWHHQKIDQPTYKYPNPDGSVPEGAAKRRQTRMKSQNSTNTHRTFDEHSPNTPRTLPECSPPEGNGREGKGKDKTNPHSDGISKIPRASTPGEGLSAVEVSVNLIAWERDRGKAARGISASQPQVLDLAKQGVTHAELRQAYDMAVADRLATGDQTPVNAGFVLSLLAKVRSPPKPKPAPAERWWASRPGIDRKGREMGMTARGGETYDDFAARIRAEIERRSTQEAA